MAQSNVYSLNVVGYINLTVPAGYSLVTAQLQGSDTSLAGVLGTNVPSSQISVVKWNPATQSLDSNPPTFYNAADLAGTGLNPGWYTLTGASTSTISLGESFFILNSGTSTTLTLVGQVSQATNTVTFVPGYTFIGVPVPVASDITTNGTLQLPLNDQLSYQFFSAATSTYGDSYNYYNAADLAGTGLNPGFYDTTSGSSTPAAVIPAVGQGFLVLNSGASTTWKPSFTVQ